MTMVMVVEDSLEVKVGDTSLQPIIMRIKLKLLHKLTRVFTFLIFVACVEGNFVKSSCLLLVKMI